MSSTIKELKSRHRRMMEALVFEGKRPVEVAIEFGITESRLSILRRSPLWQVEEEALCKEFREQHKVGILRLIPKCIEKSEELLDSEDGRLAHGVVKDLLNRAGLIGDNTVAATSGATVRIVLED